MRIKQYKTHGNFAALDFHGKTLNRARNREGSVKSRLVQNEALSIINYSKMSLFHCNARKLGDFVNFHIFLVSMTFDRRDIFSLD